MDYYLLTDLAAQVGHGLAISGAETFRVEDTIRRILRAYGIECEVFAIPNCLTISFEAANGKPLTIMKRIGFHGNDLDAVEQFNALSRRICRETPEVEVAVQWLEETQAGACCGTSTVTTFVESASGVEAGGRTGLTALTTAVMFLACIFIAPIAAIIPAAATSSALIYVGILMLQGLKNLDFNDLDQIVPVFIMLIAMPISGSIGHGIGLAMISYTIIKVFSGKAKDVSVLTYVIAALFIVKFFAVV